MMSRQRRPNQNWVWGTKMSHV